MKFLFDLFPVILFFAVYKLGQGHEQAAHALVQQYMSGLISGGASKVDQAPLMLATMIAIIATACQIAYLKMRGRTVDGLLWVSLAVIGVMGGATIYFHNPVFILWKPTILYWILAMILFVGQVFFGNNLMRKVMEEQFKLPDAIWDKLGYVWMVFLCAVGVVNLLAAFVVFKEDLSAWINFKLFGITAIFFVFFVAQGLYLSKYMEEPT